VRELVDKGIIDSPAENYYSFMSARRVSQCPSSSGIASTI
jgi:hypothetical protein